MEKQKRKNYFNNIYTKLALIFLLLILLIILPIILNINRKKKAEEFAKSVKTESTDIIKGKTTTENLDRYNLILEEVEKRERLIIEQDKVKDKKDKNNPTIDSLLEKGIRVDEVEFIKYLLKEQLFLDTDNYIQDDMGAVILKIGYVEENIYSYEIRLKKEYEIIEKEKQRIENEKLVLIDRYE